MSRQLFRSVLSPAALSLPVLFLTMAGAARAQVRNMGEVADGLAVQIGLIGETLGIVAAVMGLGLAIMGLLKFKAHSANPNDPSNKPSTAFVLIFAGAALVALPAVIGSGVSTIFGNTSGVITHEDVPSYLDL